MRGSMLAPPCNVRPAGITPLDFSRLAGAGTRNLLATVPRHDGQHPDGVGEGRAAYLERYGTVLGLPIGAETAERFGLGFLPVWFESSGRITLCLTAAMRDAAGDVTGFGLRYLPDGHGKCSYPDGRNALYFPIDLAFVPDAGAGVEWIDVAKTGRPCPVCGSDHWCSVTDEPEPRVAICKNKRQGARGQMPDGRWRHVLTPKGEPRRLNASPLMDRGGPVIVVEGVSDALTAYVLGFDSVGRPSAMSKVDDLILLVRGRDVVVLGENDKKGDGRWPGREGAVRTAEALAAAGVSVRLVMPPKGVKDLRAWYINQRLTREQFLAYVESEATTPKGSASPAGREPAAKKVAADAEAVDELFRYGDALYVLADIGGGRREVYEVRGDDYATLLRRRAYARDKSVLGERTVTEAQLALAAEAQFAGADVPVHVRVAALGDTVYLDLMDPGRQVAVVKPDGWTLISMAECPVRFIRHRGMQGLPVPVKGGSLALLRPYASVTEDGWALYVGSLLAPFMGKGAKPIIGIQGSQDSGKSTVTKVYRRLVDPHETELRSLPTSERDFAVSTKGSYVLAYDNVSKIDGTASDLLCRASTGGGFATRELYSDSREVRLNIHRQVILNGIPPDLVSREDLRSRTVLIPVLPVDPERRRSESELWEAFEAERPLMLGALLDAVSTALRRRADVQLGGWKPRLLDLYVFVLAAEPSLPLMPGVFAAALKRDQDDAAAASVENCPVAQTVEWIMSDGKNEWVGTATDLLKWVQNPSNPASAFGRSALPVGARAVKAQLNRVKPSLHAVGIAVGGRKSGGKKFITLSRWRPNEHSE